MWNHQASVMVFLSLRHFRFTHPIVPVWGRLPRTAGNLWQLPWMELFMRRQLKNIYFSLFFLLPEWKNPLKNIGAFKVSWTELCDADSKDFFSICLSIKVFEPTGESFYVHSLKHTFLYTVTHIIAQQYRFKQALKKMKILTLIYQHSH